MARTFYVSIQGSDLATGEREAPFRTVNHAAQCAMAGDTVQVGPGTYREWVRPLRGGRSAQEPITYRAEPGEHVAIKGSEIVNDWAHCGGTVWQARLPREFFGDFNPFAEEVWGDWIVYEEGDYRRHLGEVYLDGKAGFEAASAEDVISGSIDINSVDKWTDVDQGTPPGIEAAPIWHATVAQDHTILQVDFRGADPREHLVEINVRPAVFFPTQHHLDYITISGFELAQAATPWTPPTADQPGLVGPNWAKGWVIENNDIHDAKCSAVSLGKEISTGHNLASLRGDKPGYQYQIEAVFQALQSGWSWERIGSHVVRNNSIHDCGQNGIVGHMGAAFSTIANNHIYRIGSKREFYGYEIGGIKLHAPIDTLIVQNIIHDCTVGTWLDWQAQGTQVSRNLFFQNARDLFIEVSHGPYCVDNNIFASPASIETMSQGGAFINNLVIGTLRVESAMDRATPYHFPHSTQVAGFGAIRGGDDRFFGNIFAGDTQTMPYGPNAEYSPTYGYGTAVWDVSVPSLPEYIDLVMNTPGGDHAKYREVTQPVYVAGNLYLGEARAYANEVNPVYAEGKVNLRRSEEGLFLEFDLDRELLAQAAMPPVHLPPTLMSGAPFSDANGQPIEVNVDFLGENGSGPRVPGPIRNVDHSSVRVGVITGPRCCPHP